jgi:hypothetical protein
MRFAPSWSRSVPWPDLVQGRSLQGASDTLAAQQPVQPLPRPIPAFCRAVVAVVSVVRAAVSGVCITGSPLFFSASPTLAWISQDCENAAHSAAAARQNFEVRADARLGALCPDPPPAAARRSFKQSRLTRTSHPMASSTPLSPAWPAYRRRAFSGNPACCAS